MIYEYKNRQFVNGRVNRKRIRDCYDPDVKFEGHSYHPIWGKEPRSFIVINFVSEYHQQIFELEFGRAELTELEAIPEMEPVGHYG